MPLRGGSHIDLPPELKRSNKGLINIKNNDKYCVIWNLIRHKNPRAKDPQRVTLKDRSLFKNYDLKRIFHVKYQI